MIKSEPKSYCGLLIDSFDNYNSEDIIDLSNKYNFCCCGLNTKIISNEIIKKLKKNRLIITAYSDRNITYEYSKILWDLGVTSIFIDDPTDYIKS